MLDLDMMAQVTAELSAKMESAFGVVVMNVYAGFPCLALCNLDKGLADVQSDSAT